MAAAKGLCTGGASAGYVYSTKEMSPVTNSAAATIDAEARKNPGRYYAYAFKKVKTNWYVFYEMDW